MLHKLSLRKASEKRSRWHLLRQRSGERYCINLVSGIPLSGLIGIVSGLTESAGGFLQVPMLVRISDFRRISPSDRLP